MLLCVNLGRVEDCVTSINRHAVCAEASMGSTATMSASVSGAVYNCVLCCLVYGHHKRVNFGCVCVQYRVVLCNVCVCVCVSMCRISTNKNSWNTETQEWLHRFSFLWHACPVRPTLTPQFQVCVYVCVCVFVCLCVFVGGRVRYELKHGTDDILTLQKPL